jgi:hypothetical protein
MGPNGRSEGAAVQLSLDSQQVRTSWSGFSRKTFLRFQTPQTGRRNLKHDMEPGHWRQHSLWACKFDYTLCKGKRVPRLNLKTTSWMFYWCFRLHDSWYRYTIRFYIYYTFRPDVAIFRYTGSHNRLFLFLLLTLANVYTLGVHYIMVLCDALCFEIYSIFKILKFFIFGILKLGLKLRLILGSC